MTTASEIRHIQDHGLYSPANEHDACGAGFVAHIKGHKSHAIVQQGLKILENLDHRGAVGADKLMGDGAGILIQLPDALYREEMAKQNVMLPPPGEYGVGMVFLPKEHASRMACEQALERAVKAEGQVLLGWRDVPVNRDMPMSPTVRLKEPILKQIFIGRGNDVIVQDALERKLYVIRKTASAAIQNLHLTHSKEYYVPSMSSRTVVYKGLLLADQVGEEQRVVYDHDLRRAQPHPGALIVTFLRVAVFTRARRGVGVDGVPDLRTRRRFQVVPQAGGGGLGPLGDALQFCVVGVGEERRAVGECVAEPRRAEVIRFADEHRRSKVGVTGEGGVGFKNAPADRQVLRFDLLLQRDGVRRHDHLPALVDGVDEPREEIGEGFADARPGLEQQRLVGGHGRGDRVGHLRLLGAVLQMQRGAELATLGENVAHLFAHPRRLGAGVGGGVGVIIQSDHECPMSGVNPCGANENPRGGI